MNEKKKKIMKLSIP